jgi:hypothetical protein
MARTLKPATQIKNQMQSFINKHGISEGIKNTQEGGSTVSIMPPGRFGPGYIRVITPDQQNWVADLGSKSLHPSRQTHLENFYSK